MTALLKFTLSAIAAMMNTTFSNPIVQQRADPWVYRHSDGFYYFTASVPEYDCIELRRAPTIQDLGDASKHVVWRKHPKGAMGAHIWAPELHFIDGKWYIYFAAAPAESIWEIRIFVLENASPNPLEGEWIERGQLRTKWESFSLDATTFEHRGTRYLVWAQHNPELGGNTSLYLARMDSPASIAGKQVMISTPELAWEKVGFSVNEGPAVLKKNGRIFITYSASATDANYCMGLLTADENSDLLDARSWKKSPKPVLKTNEKNYIFGPGHNSFTTTPDGTTDILIFHARNHRDIVGDPLNDPNRHTLAQPVSWNADGTPDFGAPTMAR